MTCDFSHMNFDHPIVAPGRPGASHLHVVFGNTGIDHASTQASIEGSGNSTCAGGIANRTGYWVPAVIDTLDGRPLRPTDILVYYKSDPMPGATVTTFARGLRRVAGDSSATAPQQSNIDWGCLSDTTEVRGRATAHADWFNGWHQGTEQPWAGQCMRVRRDCHGDLLDDGSTLY